MLHFPLTVESYFSANRGTLPMETAFCFWLRPPTRWTPWLRMVETGRLGVDGYWFVCITADVSQLDQSKLKMVSTCFDYLEESFLIVYNKHGQWIEIQVSNTNSNQSFFPCKVPFQKKWRQLRHRRLTTSPGHGPFLHRHFLRRKLGGQDRLLRLDVSNRWIFTQKYCMYNKDILD